MSNKTEAKILIIDDEPEFADGMAGHLTESGYLVKVAYNGEDGLAKFRAGVFDLVFTDLKMPGMDGMAVLRDIKSSDSRVSVVMLTGHGTIEAAVQAIKEGAYDFVTKPATLSHLEVVIERALEKHRLVKQLDFFRGLTLAVLISIPVWLILGIILAWIFFK